MSNGKIISVANQKGGTGKSTTAVNLGVDLDPQGDATTCLGWKEQDNLPVTLSTLMSKVIQEEPFDPHEGILHHSEGIDLLPGNIELSAMEMALNAVMSRESILGNCLQSIRQEYDVCLLDCAPSLSMLTINALAAANSVIIPVQAHYLPAKGMTQLLQTISRVKKHINPELKIEGILLTLADTGTNLAKNTERTIKETYGGHLRVFDTIIPKSIKAAEVSSTGKSIFTYDPGGKATKAYENLVKEVLNDGAKQRSGIRSSFSR